MLKTRFSILTIFSALILSSVFSFAAEETVSSTQGPVQCGLAFTAKGWGFQILAGHFRLKGHGVVKCEDQDGNVERIPVNVTLGGHPLAARVAMGGFHIAGVATGIGWNSNPESFIGHYLLIGGQAAYIGGAGAEVGFHAARGAATVDGVIQAVGGIGFEAGVSTLRIERAD